MASRIEESLYRKYNLSLNEGVLSNRLANVDFEKLKEAILEDDSLYTNNLHDVVLSNLGDNSVIVSFKPKHYKLIPNSSNDIEIYAIDEAGKQLELPHVIANIKEVEKY